MGRHHGPRSRWSASEGLPPIREVARVEVSIKEFMQKPLNLRTLARRWFAISVLFVVAVSSSLAATRHYYLADENVTWDYAPSGLNLIEGRPIPMPWASQPQWPKLR